MPPQLTDIAPAVTSGATAAWMATGRPPQEVIAWAIVGALVAVWLNKQPDETPLVRWIINAVFTLFISVTCGIVGSALVTTLAPAYGWTQPLAQVPQWVHAFVIAALIHILAPLALSLFRRWAHKRSESHATPNA